MWRVAVLHHGSPTSIPLTRLREGLRIRGLYDGDNCVVDTAGSEGRLARLPALMDQLLKREPDVVVALGALAALAAQRATSRIPILHAIVLDPRDVGLIAGNVSGITTFDPEQAMRHVRLLQHLVPDLRRLACVTDAHAPRGPNGRNPLLSQLIKAATAQGLDLGCILLDGVDADLGEAFKAAQRGRAQALVVLEVPAVLARLNEIARSAERLRLPTLAPYSGSLSGVVMEGTALQDAIDPLAAYVAALHGGASLAELPLQTVRQERLVIHCGRARRTGLTVPQAVLDRATRCLPGEGAQDRDIACLGTAEAKCHPMLSPPSAACCVNTPFRHIFN